MNRDRNENRTAFDPLISMTDDGRHIHVTFDLPGVTEEHIRIDLEKTTCTLCIQDEERMVKKAIQVPQGARLFRKKFSDGILEIVLDKPAP